MKDKEIIKGISLMVGEKNEKIANPYSGVEVKLKPDEVAVYDFIKGCEILKDYKNLRKGLDWFMENNADAYFKLLD